jgi:hypothetical protein
MNRAVLARRCFQAALVLCLVGLVLGLLALWGQQRAAAAALWRDPADDVQAAAIALDLALLSLAGAPDEQVLALALETGEGETVRALLAFSPDLGDQERLNGWLWLAYHYQKAAQTQRAAQAYRMAGNGAILSVQLPALLQAETLLTAGQQLIALHDKPGAHFYLGQAALIGAHAQGLTNYHRRALLERLVPLILQAGGRRDDWSALGEAVDKGTTSKGGGGTLCQRVAPGYDAELVHARDARRAAAVAWLAALSGERDTTRECDALRQALLAEDAAVQAYLGQHTDPAARQTRLHWLLLKRRIAAGGAGDRLVPEWTASDEEIRAQLSAAWTDWLATYNKNDRQRQAACASRQAIVAAYWGLYPDAPIVDLLLAVQNIVDLGGLYLVVLKSGTPPVVGWQEQTD